LRAALPAFACMAALATPAAATKLADPEDGWGDLSEFLSDAIEQLSGRTHEFTYGMIFLAYSL